MGDTNRGRERTKREISDEFNNLSRRIFESAKHEQEERARIRGDAEKRKREAAQKEKWGYLIDSALERAEKKRQNPPQDTSITDVPAGTEEKMRKVKSICFKKK